MAEQTYNMIFDGYWREKNIGGIPAKSGIYCVYACVFNESEKTVSIKNLIYIGESENVNDRIVNHEKFSEWKKYLRPTETLCFNFGEVPSNSRIRCEAAMIFKHKPPVNTEYKLAFPFDKTNIKINGKITQLISNFTVKRT